MMDATEAMMQMLFRAAQVGLFALWLFIAILLFDAGMHG